MQVLEFCVLAFSVRTSLTVLVESPLSLIVFSTLTISFILSLLDARKTMRLNTVK